MITGKYKIILTETGSGSNRVLMFNCPLHANVQANVHVTTSEMFTTYHVTYYSPIINDIVSVTASTQM